MKKKYFFLFNNIIEDCSQKLKKKQKQKNYYKANKGKLKKRSREYYRIIGIFLKTRK